MNTISIITICLNNLKELIETCDSVDAQTRRPEEHIIIDGSSTNEIIDWLTNNEQPFNRRWIHERDNGISDAFNKGIRNCSSSIIHILNSGDKYYDISAVEIVMNVFDNDPQLKWAHSLYVQHRGDVDVISGAPFKKEELWKGMRLVAHPTMFIKKEVYERHGLYDLNYKIAMDYNMLIRIKDEKFCFINKPLVYFSPGGASNLQFQKGLNEVKRSYQTHVGKSYRQQLWQFRQKMLQHLMRTSLGKKWFRLKNRKKIRN